MSEVHAEEDQQRIGIRPLTRRNKAGLVYERAAGVELQIKTALALEPARVVERARLSDHQAHDYLQEESLVYRLREYHRIGDSHVVNELAAVLLRRCAKSCAGYHRHPRPFRSFTSVTPLFGNRGVSHQAPGKQ